MIPVLLILIPLLSGFASFFIKNGSGARGWSLFASIATLVISLLGLTVLNTPANIFADVEWQPLLGSRFTVKLDGMGQLLCLLTAISFPLIFVATWKTTYTKAHNFYGLMLLTQAGLMGLC